MRRLAEKTAALSASVSWPLRVGRKGGRGAQVCRLPSASSPVAYALGIGAACLSLSLEEVAFEGKAISRDVAEVETAVRFLVGWAL
jgi:hypothetical protein